MIAHGHSLDDIVWTYTVDQFNLFQRYASRRKIADDIGAVANSFHGPAAAFGSKASFEVVKESLRSRNRALNLSKNGSGTSRDINGTDPAKKKGMPRGWGENFVRQLTGAGIPMRKRSREQGQRGNS